MRLSGSMRNVPITVNNLNVSGTVHFFFLCPIWKIRMPREVFGANFRKDHERHIYMLCSGYPGGGYLERTEGITQRRVSFHATVVTSPYHAI